MYLCVFNILVLTGTFFNSELKLPQPLYYTKSICSDENTIRKWINGHRKQSLVTSVDFVKGFEHELVIVIFGSNAMASRTSGYLFETLFDAFTFANIKENLKKSHDCQSILNRDARPKFDLDISPFIGM